MITSVPSIMDANVGLNWENWAVTLTCDKGRSFHARLVFEGFETPDLSTHFYQVADLKGLDGFNSCEHQGCSFGKSGVGVVHLTDKKSKERFKAQYRKKTETWVVSSDKIRNLIEKIGRESQRETPFQICGSKSIFAKKAEIFEIYDQDLGEISKENRDLFLRLYDSSQNSGECTGMSREDFDIAISKVLVATDRHFSTHDLRYPDLIDRVKNFTEKLDKSQHSCFTWARENLETLGIILMDNQFESLISITTFYATRRAEEITNHCACIVEREPVTSRWDGYNLYERFVSFETNRDKRTEDWKVIESKSKLTNITANVFNGISTLSFATMVPILVGAPVLLITAPFVAIPAFMGSFAVGVVAGVSHGFLKRKQTKLLDDISRNRALNQSGNNISNVSQIRENIFTKVDERSEPPRSTNSAQRIPFRRPVFNGSRYTR